MPKDDVWPTDPQSAMELLGRYHGEPVKCMACAAASEAQKSYYSQEHHDEHGIHFIIRDRELAPYDG